MINVDEEIDIPLAKLLLMIPLPWRSACLQFHEKRYL